VRSAGIIAGEPSRKLSPGNAVSAGILDRMVSIPRKVASKSLPNKKERR